MGQQWPATGTGALAVADLGGTARGLSPFGGVAISPPQSRQVVDPQVEGNYTKEVLTLLQKL